ncbi:hypothetical protein EG329_003319 [Mollisiaceae sp. DMI_Dod_QoI]|nr:hypothetical protein EG329_003319 [Helotiales sp. DMI_Dod_QoI]
MTTTTTGTNIPLTTQFAPSASCLTDLYATTAKIFVTDAIGYAQLGPPANAACQPSGWDSTSQYFSPGMCPSGYGVACSNIVGVETQATCCPISWSCQISNDWPQYSTDACTVNASNLPGSSLIFTSVNGTSTTTYAMNNSQAGGLNAYGVSIRWKAADFASTTSSPTSSSTSRSASPSTTPTTSGAASTSSAASNPNTSSGLSSGAKAGIGVGVTVGALAILGALFMFFWRYRRQQTSEKGLTEPVPVEHKHPNAGNYAAAEVNPGAAPPVYHEVDGSSTVRSEIQGTPRSELH